MSNQQILVHVGTPDDEPYQHKLSVISAGQQVAWKSRLSTPKTVAEVEFQCKSVGATGIFCTNQKLLELLLDATPDYTRPNNRKERTLDDFQGSFLRTPREKIPVVIANPLQNLLTVGWAMPAAKRFLRKLTAPSSWFPQTKFTWEEGTPENLPQYFARWKARATLISIDIETPVPATPERHINCVGFCAYFADTHTTECIVIPFTDMFFWNWVKNFCELPQPKVMQGGDYDCVYLLRWGITPVNYCFDTLNLMHCMFSEYPKRLDFIAAYALRDVRFWKDDGKSGDVRSYLRYCAMDNWGTVNSFLSLLREAEDYALTNYLLEFPKIFPCITCGLEGIAVDMESMAAVKAQKEQEVELKQRELETSLATPGFNPNSPVQVKALFTVLGCGSLPDTSKPSMLKAKAAHPLNDRVLTEITDIREARKLLSNYLDPEKVHYGRILYRLNPAGTDTGRFACTESSFWCGFQIQNVPRGDLIKRFLVADPGWYYSEIDKAQSEARCVGYLSGETKLIELVESDKDYHSWNAAQFFGVTYSDIWDDRTHKTKAPVLRDLSKRTNHGANYNMSAGVMLDTMGPKNVARAKATLRLRGSLKQVCQFLLERYERTYPRVKGLFYDTIISKIERTQRLVSPLGWTRIFFSKPSKANKPALNAAVAHAPQNLSVGIINEEFYNVWRCQIYGEYYKREPGIRSWRNFSRGTLVVCDLRGKLRVKAQIHDSVFFQYRPKEVCGVDVPAEVLKLMTTPVQVTGADDVTRVMLIPSDVSLGKKDKASGQLKLAKTWAELK